MGNSNQLGAKSSSDDVLSEVKQKYASEAKSLEGAAAVVTGASPGGLGWESAKTLAQAGMNVWIGCRSQEKGETAQKTLAVAANSENIHFVPLDLGDLKSIKSFATQVIAETGERGIKVLLNNAGIMMIPDFTTTSFGVESQFGVNHVGHAYLTDLLLPSLKAAAPSRIVNVSSALHSASPRDFSVKSHIPPEEATYNPTIAYGISKASNIWFSQELQKRYGDEGVDAFSLHPGVIATNLVRNGPASKEGWGNNSLNWMWSNVANLFLKSIPQGSATSLFCAIHPEAKENAGGYFADCAPETPKARVSGKTNVPAALWQWTQSFLKENAPKDTE